MKSIVLHAVIVGAAVSLSLRNASAFSTTGKVHYTSSSSESTSFIIPTHRTRVPVCSGIQDRISLVSLHATDSSNDDAVSQTPLCDLQTFLRLCDLVQSGGEAKTVIQNGSCLLNGVVETRRAKKLFLGDTVSFENVENLDVATEVEKKGYVFKQKVKKVKPVPKVDADGNLEFGGRYRSEEWRAERKLKKADRKRRNQGSK